MRDIRLQYFCLALTWITGLTALLVLPDPTPIHWNAAGQVDGYGSPWLAALLVPAIVTAITLLTPLLPRLDPRGESYAAFRGTYQLLMNAAVLFLTAVHFVTIGYALGLPINVAQVLIVGVGLLLALMGSELHNVQPNYFVGIRTPWTLAEPEVWRRTHRVGGRAFLLVGLGISLGGLLLPPTLTAATVLFGSLGLVAFLFGYSYLAWRRITQRVDT